MSQPSRLLQLVSCGCSWPPPAPSPSRGWSREGCWQPAAGLVDLPKCVVEDLMQEGRLVLWRAEGGKGRKRRNSSVGKEIDVHSQSKALLTNWLHAHIQEERNNLGRLNWEFFGSNFNPVLLLEMFLLQAFLGGHSLFSSCLEGEFPPASKRPGDVKCQSRSLALSQDVGAPKRGQCALWGWLSLLMPCELPCGSWSFLGIALLPSL